MPDHPLAIALLVILVLAAIAAGLWFGNALGSGELSKKITWKAALKKIRSGLTKIVINLWKRSRSDD